MNTYTLLTNGLQTHQLRAESLPPEVEQALPKVERALTGPAKAKEVICISVSEAAEKRLGKRCPQIGQRFISLAEAARLIGTSVQALYQSRHRGERRENRAYGAGGIEFGLVEKG